MKNVPYICGMKQKFAHIIICLLAACNLAAQTTKVTGTVSDGKEPLAAANVFISGTIDGCMTDTLGRFCFTTTQKGEVTLKVTYMGYDDYTRTAHVSELKDIDVRLHERATSISEVVVTASTFSFGKSDGFKTMDALDVVMSGNSCGDVVAALQSLPGTQKVGEDGKLYVRGGESEECQTFINGMHVLVPYTTNTENTTVRGRFSPFLFKGINFTLGGYNGEYGQALSAVLPMETTDMATSDKLGVSASLVDWNIGGTKVFNTSALSFNTTYTSMGLYDRLFAQRQDFSRPYRKLSGEAQYKQEFGSNSVLKSYVGYDLTSVGLNEDDRHISLKEHNIYANLTYKTTLGHGYTLFAGMANSSVWNHIDDAVIAGDHYRNYRNEVHLKTQLRKVVNERLKLQVGIEDYIRHSTLDFAPYHYTLDYNILGAHADAQLRLLPKVFLNVSGRAEMLRHSWLLMPRTTLSYIPNKRLQLSLVTGRYSQTPQDDQQAQSGDKLRQSTANHLILSMQYRSASSLLRIEPYLKSYRHLPRIPQGQWLADGYGTSRGVDVYAEDHSITPRLTTTLAYSFCDAERLYQDATELCTPSFASRHNLRLSAKYTIGKCILGMAESYATGRHFVQGTTPHYNSVDVNLTYLLSPKIIIYTSFNNVLGRTNIHRYDAAGRGITSNRDRFFYVTILVSLKNNKAYDVSNF
ncbi:TonB-dependent receptor [Prevotella sp. P6B1]|uniref:TonB-dependent receptor n=1 Tax=Prevotella sp. P6B1 TaxID=1410613 RepID=UPI0009E0762E|nr:TonB-dependent receptor [Prevotella sp. P6B1]